MKEEKYTDMLDYLKWRGDLTFDQVPFCPVDALILAQVTYIHFDGLLEYSYTDVKTISELYKKFTDDTCYEARCDMGAVINPNTPVLLKACAESNRFKNIGVCGYQVIHDELREEQFAAVTFIIDKKNAVVSFRGTDDSLCGWKEDMNIIYMETIPSERSAVEYLNKTAEAVKQKLTVVGHSKGGCVALYASIYCHKKTKNKITDIYNFDGPGFPKAFFETPEFLEAKPKLHSYYPHFDVVGMVFYHSDIYKIVDSDGFTVFQHDAFSWHVVGNDFVYVDDFADESKILNTSFNEWIDSLSIEDRERFANVFFGVIYASGAKTNKEIENNKMQASSRMLAALHELKPEEKKHVNHLIKMFLKTGFSKMPMFAAFNPVESVQNSAFVEKIESAIDKLKEKNYERNN